jgi:hemerythrin-like domain-containing protein
MNSDKNLETDHPGMRVINRLEQDHQRTSTLLGLLQQTLATKGDVDWLLTRDIIAYLQDYPDKVHHPLEDHLFDLVLDKGLPPAECELVRKNLRQHAQIMTATDQLAQEVEQILADIAVPIDHLKARIEHYISLQTAHMNGERDHLFPLAYVKLSESDWHSIQLLLDEGQPDPLTTPASGRFRRLYDCVSQYESQCAVGGSAEQIDR